MNLTRWDTTIAAILAEQLRLQAEAAGDYSHDQRERWYALDWQLYLRGL